MPHIELSTAERKAHRAEAHHLDPVVMIGNDGLTPSVLKETDAALNAHGLIKIRVLGDDRAAREKSFMLRPSSTSASCWCCGGPSRKKSVPRTKTAWRAPRM